MIRSQPITWTECILNYIGVTIDISHTESSASSYRVVWFCFSQLFDDTLSRNKDLNKSSSSRNTSIESWDEMTPHQNDDDVISKFPVKDTFSIGVQPICKCTQEKGSQYHNMIIKKSLARQLMDLGYLWKALAHKHYQFHVIVRILKKITNLLNQVSHIWLLFFFISCDNAYTHESTSSFYFKKFRNNVMLQWEFGKSELCKQRSLNKVF